MNFDEFQNALNNKSYSLYIAVNDENDNKYPPNHWILDVHNDVLSITPKGDSTKDSVADFNLKYCNFTLENFENPTVTVIDSCKEEANTTMCKFVEDKKSTISGSR